MVALLPVGAARVRRIPSPTNRSVHPIKAERIDKVRSTLGVSYKIELHYAVAHMRRWDGAYPPLANVTKAVDLMKVEKGPRCVALA